MMRLLSVFLLLTLATAAPAAPLHITVQEESAWGKGAPKDIRAVALSAATELFRHCPHTQIDEIVIHHRDGTPQTDWERDQEGRIVVGLAAHDMFWAQFAYQFAHEFCHILAMHSNDWQKEWRGDGKPNHWLEESLCETASLFALRAMGKSWAIDPPYPNWKDFAPMHTDYARERIDDPRHCLPSGTAFPEWFRAAEPGLRKNSAQREKNTLIARQLLPIFEADPRGWEALTYFNLGPHDRTLPLAPFLTAWRDRCPAELQPVVQKIAATLGAPLQPR
jgi:hypothetical protein